MKAEELRIGNWLIGCNGVQFKIDAYGIMDCHYEKSVQECLQPIPLTPEILEKCGFEFYDDECQWKIQFEQITMLRSDGTKKSSALVYISICTNNNEDFAIYFEDKFIIIIANVHQLQNLFYCLSGQELEINL